MSGELETFLQDVQTHADRRSPELWANLFGSAVPESISSCYKCSTLVVRYARLKIDLHHARKNKCPGWLTQPDGSMLRTTFHLERLAADARAKFYECPCVCGRRKEYVIQ